MIRKICVIFVLSLLIINMHVYADTLHVGEGQEFRSITDAVAASEDGDEIIIYEGIYDETIETFPIEPDKDNLYIHSAEGESVTLRSPLTYETMKVWGAGSRIEGLNIEFIRSSGMHVLADDVVIDGCHFELGDPQWRETSCGLWIAGSKHVTVCNTEFINSSMALAGPPVYAPSSEVPVLTALFEVGEDPEYFTTHTIENTTVNGKPVAYLIGLEDQEVTGDYGQIIAAECENVTFKNLDFFWMSIGLQLVNSNNCKIMNTNSNDSGIFGIYIAKCDDCCIDNVTADRGGHGIDFRDCNRCTVQNCSACECGQGIFFTWSEDCTTTNCQMIDDGTGFFSSGGKNLCVDSCLIERNELGFYIQSDEMITVINSEIKENTSCGLRMTDCTSVVNENTFTDNNVGSLVLNSDSAGFLNNTFSGSLINDLYFKNCSGMEYEQNEFLSELEENIVIENEEES